MIVDPKGEQSDLEQAAGSTRAPSTLPDLEDEKKSADASSTDQEKGEAEILAKDEVAEVEYPTGFRLYFIVVSLVISMFLVSLDMVSPTWLRNRCKHYD